MLLSSSSASTAAAPAVYSGGVLGVIAEKQGRVTSIRLVGWSVGPSSTSNGLDYYGRLAESTFALCLTLHLQLG